MAAAGTAVIGLGKIGVSYNAEMEKYTTALTTALGSTEKAAAAIEQIKADAAATPYDVSSLVHANQFLISTGESAESARATIMALTDAVSATGGGNAELQRMAQNLQQIKNYGQATALDIKQFAYAGIDIYGILADYTGKAVDEVKDMTISYELLNNALIAASQEGGKYYGANIAQSQTLNGQLSTLKDNAKALLGEVFLPISDGLRTEVLPTLNEFLSSLSTAFSEGGVSGLISEAGNVISELVSVFSEKAPEFASIGLEIIQQIIISITSNAQSLAEAATAILVQITESILSNMPIILQAGLDIIVGLANGLISSLPSLIPAAVEAIMTIVQVLVDNLDLLIDAALQLIMALADGLLAALPVLIEAAPEIIYKLTVALLENLPLILDVGLQVIASLISGILQAIPDLIIVAFEIVGGLLNGLNDAWPNLIENIKNLVINFIDSVKNILGIHSPSTVFSDMGKNVAAGFKEGFANAWDAVVSFVSNAINGLISMVQNAIAGLKSAISGAASAAGNWVSDTAAKIAGATGKTTGAAAGVGAGAIKVVQNIYTPSKSAADVMRESAYAQKRVIMEKAVTR